MVGPEGGIAPKEEEYLISLNFIPVTLGSNIMRTETVPIYLLSVLNYEMRE
jgi:16S rRNA (uracil1498-N3)-methyltransferase